MRRLRWDGDERGPLRRPPRDTVPIWAVLATVIVGLAYVTGGGVARAAVVAVAFFVLATGWSWWMWRKRHERR